MEFTNGVPAEHKLQAIAAEMKRLIGIATLLVLAVATWVWRAELLRLVPTPLVPIPAHEQYAAALSLTGVASSEAGRAWLEAATTGLDHPLEASAWFSATGRFDASPSAIVTWRFPARRGQRVTIDLGTANDTAFLDLFNDDKDRVASAAPRASALWYIVEHDGLLIARVQPRLPAPDTLPWSRGLQPTRYTSPMSGSAGASALASPTAYAITQRVEASLEFPVRGMDRRAVGSSFGAARDSGRRSHEGVDIFAPRRTPVVAAVDGWVTRQTTNRLGGKVVWVWAPSRRLSLYYAHLDEQAVTPGERVAAGDVIGYVGNTGNARHTPPHLHFGVYVALAGAVDPFPFIVDPDMHLARPEARSHHLQIDYVRPLERPERGWHWQFNLTPGF
jgi:peptidoglycan LD-endopeptidase LytH